MQLLPGVCAGVKSDSDFVKSNIFSQAFAAGSTWDVAVNFWTVLGHSKRSATLLNYGQFNTIFIVIGGLKLFDGWKTKQVEKNAHQFTHIFTYLYIFTPRLWWFYSFQKTGAFSTCISSADDKPMFPSWRIAILMFLLSIDHSRIWIMYFVLQLLLQLVSLLPDHFGRCSRHIALANHLESN